MIGQGSGPVGVRIGVAANPPNPLHLRINSSAGIGSSYLSGVLLSRMIAYCFPLISSKPQNRQQ